MTVVTADPLRPQVLVHRGLIEINAIGKQEPSLIDEIPQALDTWLEELDHGIEPRPPLAQVRVVPQAGGLEERPDTRRELRRRQLHDVLLIEPVQLLGVE